ncbi:MAG: hypothetical protein IJ773_06755 [Lachnospiraceae bacterium]|nr:hypothetical protein [Lachnospiraceae bacterium]
MKNFMKDRKLGFWLTLIAACAAIVAAILYLVIYSGTADPVTGVWDRVFKWLTFGLVLGGGLVSLLGEMARLRVVPILAAICYSVGLANHLVEAAYPLADVLTKVPFFGGNPALAIGFGIAFGVIAIVQVLASFMEHNKIA